MERTGSRLPPREDGNPAPAALGAPAAPPRHPEHPLTPEIRELLDRCAGLRRGLALANRAPPELAAAALGVPARVVEAGRASLADPAERRVLLREYARARERRLRSPRRRAARPEPRPRGPEEVIREAERHPLGLQFLLCAPFETAAVAFAVHPDVVLAARQALERRGVTSEER